MKDSKYLKIALLDRILGEHKASDHESIEQNFINTLAEQDNQIYKEIRSIILDYQQKPDEKNNQISNILENIDKRVDNIEVNIIKNDTGFKVNITFDVKSNYIQGYIVFYIK